MFNLYELRFFGCNGDYLFNFDTFEELEYGRQKNEVGTASLVLPGKFDLRQFDKDNILEIWRYDVTKGKLTLVGDTCWFLRKLEHKMDGFKETTTLTFEDTIGLLKRKFVAWFEIKRGFGPDEFNANYPSGIINYPDVVLDRIFYHNFDAAGMLDPITFPATPPASFARNMHELVGATRLAFPITMANPSFLPRNTALDNTQIYTFAGEDCLSAMKNIADSTEEGEENELWFDIVYTPNAETLRIGLFTFNVWTGARGVDRSLFKSQTPLIFGPDFANVESPVLTLNWEEEATFVLAVSGNIDNTVVGAATLANGVSPPASGAFAQFQEADRCLFYPIEKYYKDGNSQENNALPTVGSIFQKAQRELRRSRSSHTFVCDIVQTTDSHIFIDYNYGDIISINWKGLAFDASIKKFLVKVDRGGEQITVPFETSVIRPFLP